MYVIAAAVGLLALVVLLSTALVWDEAAGTSHPRDNLPFWVHLRFR